MLVGDTCILIDIADDDPEFGRRSLECLIAHLAGGLLISPITYIELAPVFDGSRRLLDEFLDGLLVDQAATLDLPTRDAAFSGWSRYVSERRAGRSPRRPVADALIGALAIRHDGIITRNGDDFRPFFPALNVVDPSSASSSGA
jgi:predicted nucleic acid-binding protein